MPNRYFVSPKFGDPVEFDVTNEEPSPDATISYFIRAFQILERRYGLNGYTVCFVFDSRTPLPRIGANVISVIFGEEKCRIPAYAGAVAAVMKCHGLVPTFVPRKRPLRLAQIEIAEFLRNLAFWLPTGWRYALSRRTRTRCHLIPLGYGFTTDRAPLPFDKRSLLTSFYGSVVRPRLGAPIRALIGTPKAYCRAAMLEALRKLQVRYGEQRVPLRLTGDFQESLQDKGQLYYEAMSQTTFCVAPRGTTHETMRICDGLMFGCVVISDLLPPHPFYRDSPIIQIEDWKDLPALIEELLGDPSRLRELQERSLQHWRDVLSEEAVAARCAQSLGLTAIPL